MSETIDYVFVMHILSTHHLRHGYIMHKAPHQLV